MWLSQTPTAPTGCVEPIEVVGLGVFSQLYFYTDMNKFCSFFFPVAECDVKPEICFEDKQKPDFIKTEKNEFIHSG